VDESPVDRHLHFIHAMNDEVDAVSLPELHQILQDYINRDEEEIVQLAAERKERSWRKAEGKTKRELELEQQKIEELGEYRSGFGQSLLSSYFSRRRGKESSALTLGRVLHRTELPDLTLAENVFLCRQWIRPIGSDKNPRMKGGDPSFLGRFVPSSVLSPFPLSSLTRCMLSENSLRMIRINSEDKDAIVVVREGAREGEYEALEGEGEGEEESDEEMEDA
jgi:hypothetical protein